jgi:hypothetical protein
MAVPTNILTFADRYGDPAANPLGQSGEDICEAYRVIFAEYRSESAPLKVGELEEEILTDFISPIGAIGVMVAADGAKTGHLKILHGFARYPGQAGKPNPDRKTNFCYEGEVEGTDAYTIAFDRDQLGLTAYVNVPQMLDRHMALLESEPSKPMVGPFEADEANVHTIRTRSAMFVPYDLVDLLLGKDLTAREAYMTVYPVLEDNGMLDLCLPFVEFLQVASTQPSNSNTRPFTLQDRLGKADHPVRPAVVNYRRENVLYRLLPDLRPANLGRLPDSFAESLSDGLTNIATEMHADRRSRETRAVESNRPKSFRDRYGDRIADSILLLTDVSDDDLLPPFYQELGAKRKGESERVLLQREVDQSAEAFGVLAFKVSPSQVISLKTFDFGGLSMSEVGTGVLPLSIIPPEATSLSAARALANNHAQAETYDLSGEPSLGALSTADTQRLRNQKGYLPVNWMEARTQLRCMLALLGALCGNNHAVTLSWQSMLRDYERVEARLVHEIDAELGTKLGPATFVFHLQLIIRDWFVDQTRTGRRDIVPAPDFAQYLKVFERQNNLHWLPSVLNVPCLAALRTVSATPRGAPVATPRVAVRSGGRGNGGGETPAGRGAVAQRELGPRVRNPARDARFTGNTAFAQMVRNRRVDEAIDIAGGIEAVPKVTRGGSAHVVCVSYHGKGSCYELCQRAATHTPLSTPEAALFHTWCAVAFA